MSAMIQAASPFDMLINPQAVLDAIERSTLLQGLDRKVCRPLDRVAAPKAPTAEGAAPQEAALARRFEDDLD